MAAVTVRHLEDYAYEARLRPSRRSQPDLLPADAPYDLGPHDARATFGPPPSRRAQVVHWTKKVVHMPIAERYLLISLTLLTRRPMPVLWALFVAVVVAVAWTQGGRIVAVFLRRDPTWAAVVPATARGELDEQLDLGPVARLVGRLVGRTSRPRFVVGLAGAAVLVVLVPLLLWTGPVAASLAAAVVGSGLVAVGWQPPVHDRLGWQAPAALWVAEALAVGVLVHHTLGVQTAAAFAYVAAVAYHRYDVVYRLRDTGTAPAAWLATAGLGTEGRLIGLLLLATFAPAAVVPVLWVAAVLLAVLYLVESATGWRRWIAAQGDPLATGART
jgi:hypothetical protein